MTALFAPSVPSSNVPADEDRTPAGWHVDGLRMVTEGHEESSLGLAAAPDHLEHVTLRGRAQLVARGGAGEHGVAPAKREQRAMEIEHAAVRLLRPFVPRELRSLEGGARLRIGDAAARIGIGERGERLELLAPPLADRFTELSGVIAEEQEG